MSVNIREFKSVIPAGGRTEINSEGNSIRCLGSNRAFTIRFPEKGSELPMEQGLGYTLAETFKKVEIYNPTDVDLTCSLVISIGADVTDDRQNFSADNAIPIRSLQPLPVLDASAPKVGTLTKYAVSQAGVTIPANESRKSIRFQNIGAVAVLIEGGIWLDPLQAFETDATNALSVATNGNTNGAVSVWEVS